MPKPIFLFTVILLALAVPGWPQGNAKAGLAQPRNTEPRSAVYNVLANQFVADGATARPTDNLPAWNALLATLPIEGGVIQFPEGNFYFSNTPIANKPVQIIGAGMVPVADVAAPKGTVLLIASGHSGLQFVAGASGSSVRDVTLVTKNGHTRQTIGHGIHSTVKVRVENVYIKGFAQHGIFLDSTGQKNNTNLSSLVGVQVYDNKLDGFRLEGGDTNVITVLSCDATLNGRHGFYSAGYSNVFINTHTAFNARSTPGAKDYFENGGSNTWVHPYAESTESGKFFFGENASYCDLAVGQFGKPTIEFARVGIALAGHRILERGYLHEVKLKDVANTPGKSYVLRSTYSEEPGQLLLFNEDDNKEVFSYFPSTERLRIKNLQLAALGATPHATLTAQAGVVVGIKNNYSATSNPTLQDDTTQGYAVGSEWINTRAGIVFKCVKANAGGAIWKRISAD